MSTRPSPESTDTPIIVCEKQTVSAIPSAEVYATTSKIIKDTHDGCLNCNREIYAPAKYCKGGCPSER